MTRPVLITAGGTGGHMFPALAVARELRRRGGEVILVTDARGARFAADEPGLEVIPGAAPRGSWSQRLAGTVQLGRGLRRALDLIGRLRPRAVAAFGGYASLPVGLAAALRGVPLLVHEQNAVMGRTNRLLARFAHRVAVSFPDTAAIPDRARARAAVTGNPVRPGFTLAAAGPAPSDGRLRLLVLGGSQGARIFADLVPAAVALLDPALRARLAIAQQCRPEDLERTGAAYRAIGQPVELAAFFEDVPARMAAADLVLARAGASTVAELLALGRPAVLIPFPAAADDHQTANARVLERAGVALVLPQAGATPERCARFLAELLSDPERRRAMRAAAARLARPDAAARIAEALLTLGSPVTAGRAVEVAR